MTAGLDAAWRVPAELVRRALRAGAARVTIEGARAGLAICDDGPPLAAALIDALATLGDRGASAAARHAALVRLEAEPGLLAASPRLEHARAAGANRLLLRGLVLDAAACAALEAALRHGVADLTLDGRPLARGFPAALAEAPLPPPLRGGLALGAASEAEVALVLDGVVATRVTLPDAPGLAAWVDARSLGVEGAFPGAAALRAALAPHEAALRLAAVDLALAAVRRPEPWSSDERERLLEVLLTGARRGLRRGEILEAPALVAIEAGAPVARSLLDLGADAEASPGGLVCVLEPDEDARRVLLPDAAVYRIGPESRARLAALLGVRFRPAPPREASGGVGARARRAFRDACGALRRVVAHVAHRGARRALAASELRPGEQALLRALGPGVRLTPGSGPVGFAAGEWWLPRGNPLVAAAVRALAADPRFVYPAALALFEGRRPLPVGCAEAWSGS